MTASVPLASELFRHLRHELRTPINHIVGYSELLLESAEDMDPGVRAALVPDLERIDAAGKELVDLVNRYFDSGRAGVGLDLQAAGHDLRVPLNAVIGYSELLEEEALARQQGDLLPDIRRIAAAGGQLLGLIDALAELAPPTPDPDATPQAPDPEPAAAPSGERPQPPATHASGSLGTLLVADDNELNRDMLSRRLQRLGYTVHLAEDGQRALDLLRREAFDLLLLDIMMPVMDGFDVLAHLKSDPELRQLPVIVLSASGETESVVRCIELGAEDFLPKPFDPVLLRARIGACLEKRRLFEEIRQRDARQREELGRAREIQQRLLPVHPAAPPAWRTLVDVALRFRPAVETSGDFYDLFAQQGLRQADGSALSPLYVAVADVAGKGMAAALVMAMTRSALRFVAQPDSSPAGVMNLVAERLHDDLGRRHFVACALGRLDQSPTGLRLRVANAGQVPVLLCRAGRATELEPPGARFPLGAVQGAEYAEISTDLHPGDVVVFASDGLPEAPRRDGEYFGFHRLAASAAHWSSAATAKAVAEGIWHDVTAWCGPESHHDDMTLLVLRVPGA